MSTLATGNDLSYSHDGTDTLITFSTGNFTLSNTAATGAIIAQLGTNTTAFQVKDSGGNVIAEVKGDGTATGAWSGGGGGGTGDWVFSGDEVTLSGQTTSCITLGQYQPGILTTNSIDFRANGMTWSNNSKAMLNLDMWNSAQAVLGPINGTQLRLYSSFANAVDLNIENFHSGKYINLLSDNIKLSGSVNTITTFIITNGALTYNCSTASAGVNGHQFYTGNMATLAMTIAGDGTVNIPVLTQISDERDKTEISANTLGLDFINSLSTKKFKYDLRLDYLKKDCYDTESPDCSDDRQQGRLNLAVRDGTKKSDKWSYGLIAQEVEAVLNGSEFIQSSEHQKSLSYVNLITPMLKAIQELSQKNEALEARIVALET